MSVRSDQSGNVKPRAKYWPLFEMDGRDHFLSVISHKGEEFVSKNYGSIEEESKDFDYLIGLSREIKIVEDDNFIVLSKTNHNRGAFYSKRYGTISGTSIMNRMFGGDHRPRTKAHKYCSVRRFLVESLEVYNRDISNQFLARVAEYRPFATKWYRSLTFDNVGIFNIFSVMEVNSKPEVLDVIGELVANYRIILRSPASAYAACTLARHSLSAEEIASVMCADKKTFQVAKALSKSNLTYNCLRESFNFSTQVESKFIAAMPSIRIYKQVQQDASASAVSALLGPDDNITSSLNASTDSVITLDQIYSLWEVHEIREEVSKPEQNGRFKSHMGRNEQTDIPERNGMLVLPKATCYKKVHFVLGLESSSAKSHTDRLMAGLIIESLQKFVTVYNYTFKVNSNINILIEELMAMYKVNTYYKLYKRLQMSKSDYNLKLKTSLYNLLSKHMKQVKSGTGLIPNLAEKENDW